MVFKLTRKIRPCAKLDTIKGLYQIMVINLIQGGFFEVIVS